MFCISLVLFIYFIFLLLSYLLRCKMTDDFGNVKLAFDLEVVSLHKTSVVGVYRKRIKGDSWSYKSVCEDILQRAKL